MENRIRTVEITQRRWDASVAELWVTVEPEKLTATTEVRGKLEGPRCPGITTLEVAYPLRALPKPAGDATTITMRVVIPDPLAWQPDRPYVYEGVIELWQDRQKSDERSVRVLGRQQ